MLVWVTTFRQVLLLFIMFVQLETFMSKSIIIFQKDNIFKKNAERVWKRNSRDAVHGIYDSVE